MPLDERVGAPDERSRPLGVKHAFVIFHPPYVSGCADESWRAQVVDLYISTLSLSLFRQFIMRLCFSTKNATSEGEKTRIDES